MILTGARVAISARQGEKTSLFLRRGRAFLSGKPLWRERKIDLSGFLILPGLINAHDHLEFNLFPRVGHGPYPNASAWAKDIFRPNEPPLSEHLTIPKSLRLFWGGIKNLLSGVTSVAHHNPYQADVFEKEFPVRVLKRFGWAHSLEFSPDWEQRFRQTPPDVPFILHAAEGTDDEARNEVYRLDKSLALGPPMVLVHGVALKAEDLPLLCSRKASLIWCPSSNCFTLGRTVPKEILESGIPISLGTDSALTAEGDLIDELRIASRSVDPFRLYEMITRAAAGILRLNSGEGCIRDGGIADLLAVADHGQTPAHALLSLRPELVLLGGRIKLVSESLAHHFRRSELSGFHNMEVEERGRWLVPFDVGSLLKQTRQSLAGNVLLAGKAVTA
ncbi:MAG: amidohydrolase family protein [Acidobacteriaceae bacterium]|nr:amidohydrolase family protein [Acidobacteriaceae bacterium]